MQFMQRRTFLEILVICNFFIIGIHAQNSLDTGIRFLKNSQYKKARDFFLQKINEDEKNAEANYYLGRTFFMLNDFDQAVTYCKKAVELKANVADYHFWLGNALGRKAQKSSIFKQAWLAPKIIGEFERTIQIDSLHVGGHLAAANFYLMAPSFMGGGLEKAQKEAKILLKLDEKKGHMLLASIYTKEKKFDPAEKEFNIVDRMFNDSTDNPYFYNGYGYFLLKRKKYDKAIKMFRKFVRLVPKEANSYDSLGDGLMKAGRKDEARAAYQQALKLDPDFKPSKKKLKKLEETIQ